jgi:DNA-binding response OmpR family regulator
MADRKRIMIAEDDPEINELIYNFLTASGYDVVSVNNGRDALSKASSEKFDLLLLDVMMPYVDGYHVAYEISNSENFSPKIIIATSRDVELEKSVINLSGAHEYLQKPFELDALLAKIKKLLGEN